ncbi:MAG: hypothetical protein QGF56_06745 [Verrucomicrobiota bacterium]|nr:hypothetical protein [Verrucomicrobiota bacterium]
MNCNLKRDIRGELRAVPSAYRSGDGRPLAIIVSLGGLAAGGSGG